MLDEIVQIDKQMNLSWADFLGRTDRSNLLKMANAFGNKEPLAPIYGEGDE